MGLFQDIKEVEFLGIVQIDCDQPTHSFVTTGSSGAEQFHAVPLKNLMKHTIFPRKLVSNLFAAFCTGSSLDAAAAQHEARLSETVAATMSTPHQGLRG